MPELHQFLQEAGIRELDWPANSPVLNIIENVWAMVVRRVRKFPGMPRNARELEARVRHAWESLSANEVQNIFRSIPSPIQALLAANGGSTKY